jgi:hypothetical protein
LQPHVEFVERHRHFRHRGMRRAAAAHAHAATWPAASRAAFQF